jgi:hypothetical protein
LDDDDDDFPTPSSSLLLLLLLLLLFGTTIFWISHKRARAFFLSLFLSVEQQRKKSRALSPAKVTPL